jgi:crotonobetainyl-CoA:carnitine CoA-transferase CaiB-like acyl-CoA transferase
MMLADLGAEVIKIENPHDGGDVSRLTGPFLLGTDPASPDSQFFQSFNRNKKSLTLDLKSAAGQAVQAFNVRFGFDEGTALGLARRVAAEAAS